MVRFNFNKDDNSMDIYLVTEYTKRKLYTKILHGQKSNVLTLFANNFHLKYKDVICMIYFIYKYYISS